MSVVPVSSKVVGRLFRAKDVLVVEWEIANFSKLSDKVDAYYLSPDFAFLDACWRLKIYPNGESGLQSEGCVGLYARLPDGKCADPVDATLCLKDVTGKEQYEQSFAQTRTFETGSGYGFSKLCQRSELTRRGSELLPADVLTLRCTLKITKRRPVRVSLFERLLKVSRHMKAILKKGGKNEGEVTEEVFSYVYSGRVENLCAANVFKLYAAADKYALEELKELCTTFMKKNMAVDLFCDVVALADQHEETELMKCAKEFFRKNSIRILKSETWKQFESENNKFAYQLVVSVAKENGFKEK